MIDQLKADLTKKLIDQRPYIPFPMPDLGRVIRLADYEATLELILADAEARDTLVTEATTNYYKLSEFIQEMNPSGGDAIVFPDLAFASSDDRLKLEKLRAERGVEVAGWLRAYHADKPKSSSDLEMTLPEKVQCFYWDFRYPDDPAKENLTDPTTVGELKNLQITKAIRVPFVYRRPDKQLLLGHILIGYEGAGSM